MVLAERLEFVIKLIHPVFVSLGRQFGNSLCELQEE